MPKYRVELDGRTFELDGDHPPTEAEARAAIDSHQSAAPPPPAAEKPHGGGFVDALPTIGGTVMSMAGGSKISPVGMALGALGGAAGEGVRQVVRSVQGQWDQVPPTVMGRLRAMGTEGVTQGALEGAGRVAGAVVTPVAKAAYGLALRPAKALQKAYGLRNIVEQGFADRVLPSAIGETRAGRLVGESKNAATKIAQDSPTAFDLQRILQKATDEQGVRMGAEMKTAGIAPQIDKASEQIGRVLDSNGPTVSAAELLELRRGADAIADPAFKAARMPGGAGRVPAGTESSVAKSMANAERQTLDDALGPQWKATNAQTRNRSGVLQAAKDAASRPNMLTNLIAGGAGASALTGDGNFKDAAERALLFRTLFSPTAQAGAAFAAPAVAKYGPRIADAATGGNFKNALLRFLSGQE